MFCIIYGLKLVGGELEFENFEIYRGFGSRNLIICNRDFFLIRVFILVKKRGELV